MDKLKPQGGNYVAGGFVRSSSPHFHIRISFTRHSQSDGGRIFNIYFK
jgi:hypothetical protein